MKLEFIVLENFRQFYGRQEAEFSTEDNLNVTVFHGANGAGKTSLFSAVSWCLYQNAPIDIGDLINRRAVAEAHENDTVKAQVTVGFRHQGHRYHSVRTLLGIKHGNHWEPLSDICSLGRVTVSGVIPRQNYIDQMNSILPENVRPYFFFDGEKMDDLTKAESNEVEEAIRNFIRLPALKRAHDHLGFVAAEFRRGLKSQATQELEELIGQEEGLRAEQTKVQARLEEHKEQIRLGRDQIADLEAKLKESEQARSLQMERESHERNFATLEELEQQFVSTIQENVIRAYPIYLAPRVHRALEILDEKRQKGEVPSGVREQLIKDLLESQECICGRSFQDGDSAHQKLIQLLNRTASDKLEMEAGRLGGSLQGLSQQTTQAVDAINRATKERVRVQIQMDELRDRIDNLSRRLKDLPLEEIVGLEKRRIVLKRKMDENVHEQGRLDQRLADIARFLDVNQVHQKQLESQQARLQLQARKVNLAQRAADSVENMTKVFVEEARKSIEVATKDIFGKFAWKQEHFQDVTLSPDFHMEIIDQWGLPTRKELSAGERQILSLSFICAMSRVSGEEAPLVMDTPFGRLSGNHLVKVAQSLPELTPQLILFVTDREWDEASKTNLEPRAGSQYRLSYDDASGCTTIEEVR